MINRLRQLSHSLRARLIALFTVIALTTLLLSGFSLSRSLNERIIQLEALDLRNMGGEMNLFLMNQIDNGVPLEMAAAEIRELPLVGFDLFIFDTENNLLISKTPQSERYSLPVDWVEELSSLFEPRLIYDPNEKLLVLVEPLEDDQQIAGLLIVSTSLLPLERGLASFYPTLLIAAIGSVVGIIGAGIFITGNILRVFREIMEVTDAIAAGEFDRRVTVRGQDEVGRLAQSINEMAVRLSVLSRTQAQFLSKVSHELRTPMTIIKGFAITLCRRRDLTSDFQRPLDIINQQTDNLTHLVDDLLELARLDVDRLSIESDLIDLSAVVGEVVEAYQVVAQGRGAVLNFQEFGPSIEVLGDARRIKQVVSILLDNAFKYAHQTDLLEVDVIVSAVDESALIQVLDTGPGIAPANLPHIFKRFYQAKPDQPGMGLGLALAHELIGAHHGQIKVENRPEGGCSFEIGLPRLVPLEIENQLQAERMIS
ncbi:MAG: HAMP domain-containing sensor histidine kinase [Ardenticatenaceae bacterium]|nr:HAMP domain-containing sensor histidine kinase [Ardenticatenaceae bacterium]